jgi:hypothetical protein
MRTSIMAEYVFGVHDPAPAAIERARRLSRVRGLLLGAALGDAIASPGASLRASVTTQLSCFTAEALIRMRVRSDHKGIGPALTLVWQAYQRWARVQNLEIAGGCSLPLDGWLHEVPLMHQRRGNAPAVVSSLQRAGGGDPAPAPVASSGHHACTRLLPAAAGPWIEEDHIRQLVAWTHGNSTAVESTLLSLSLLRFATSARSASEVLDAARQLDSSHLLDGALEPGAPLQEISPSHSAHSAIRGGVAVLAHCDDLDPHQVAKALHRSNEAAVPGAVGPVAGALFGALYGVEVLPVDLLSQLDAAWVVDTLARDLVSQELDSPAGSENAAAPDPRWWDRYPGG